MPSVRLRACPSLVDEVRALVPADLAREVLVEPHDGDARVDAGMPVLELPEAPTVPSTCGSTHVAGCPRCVQSVMAQPDPVRTDPDAVAVTTGWVERWGAAGCPPVDVPGRSSVRRVVLLETRPLSVAGAFEHLAVQTGWAPTVIPVGTAFLRLEVDLLLTRWQLSRATESMRKARSAATANVLALEVFGQLATQTDEAEVIRGLSELFATLFAPRHIRFVPAPAMPIVGDTRASGPVLDGFWPSPHPWDEIEGGFRLRIAHGHRVLGLFELAAFATPEAIGDYINLSLSIARTAGMAIANARAMHGLIPICAYCKKIRDQHGAWWALESYLSRHSDARFSHGVCPTCFREQLDAEGLEP